MDNVWSWITTLPSSEDWPPADSPLILPLVTSGNNKSIVLKADRTAGSDTETLVTFSITLNGFFHSSNPSMTLWISDPIPLSSSPAPPLFLQLLNQVISAAPSPSLPPPDLTVDHDISSASPAFLSLVLLCRLFWLCASDAPADAGFLFFRELGLILDRILDCRPALGMFLLTAGPDREERFMRSLGYMLAKWCILHGEPRGAGLRATCCPAYATEARGLLVFRGYAPVFAMDRVGGGPDSEKVWPVPMKESVLKYGLLHQQLEAVVQLEYLVSLQDSRFIRITVGVDNVRLQIVPLGFARDHDDLKSECHFPSKVRVSFGPETGSAYAIGPSLGRSTSNPTTEVESIRTVKGDFGGKAHSLNAKARMSVRSRGRSWRWEQEAEGSSGVVEGVLCDVATGTEVATWRPGGGGGDPRVGMRRRYTGAGRAFGKGGRVVAAGDELGEVVTWRVGREMEGRVVKWRMGVKVWVTYFPNELRTGFFETRCVEWREEVDLPLVGC